MMPPIHDAADPPAYASCRTTGWDANRLASCLSSFPGLRQAPAFQEGLWLWQVPPGHYIYT